MPSESNEDLVSATKLPSDSRSNPGSLRNQAEANRLLRSLQKCAFEERNPKLLPSLLVEPTRVHGSSPSLRSLLASRTCALLSDINGVPYITAARRSPHHSRSNPGSLRNQAEANRLLRSLQKCAFEERNPKLLPSLLVEPTRVHGSSPSLRSLLASRTCALLSDINGVPYITAARRSPHHSRSNPGSLRNQAEANRLLRSLQKCAFEERNPKLLPSLLVEPTRVHGSSPSLRSLLASRTCALLSDINGVPYITAARRSPHHSRSNPGSLRNQAEANRLLRSLQGSCSTATCLGRNRCTVCVKRLRTVVLPCLRHGGTFHLLFLDHCIFHYVTVISVIAVNHGESHTKRI
ncbi:uncharacterized protein LOC142568646 [Dermacentor variabilis]|uniref:uncharacterized protein LOC142568646 n=1 Tax=Dermacentor variabilis TaxID=34621 RepID=UPI003F5B293D